MKGQRALSSECGMAKYDVVARYANVHNPTDSVMALFTRDLDGAPTLKMEAGACAADEARLAAVEEDRRRQQQEVVRRRGEAATAEGDDLVDSSESEWVPSESSDSDGEESYHTL